MDLEGISRGLTEVQSRNFPGGTEETHEILKISGFLADIQT